MEPSSVAARGVRTYQSWPEPAELFRRFDDAKTLPARSHTIRFLMKAGAKRTDTFSVFSYAEPERSSGFMRLEGFSPEDLQRIDDYFRIEEIGHELGYTKPPAQALDYLGRDVMRSPVPFIVLPALMIPPLVVLFALSVAGFLPQLGGIWTVPVCVVPLLLLMLVLGARRLLWWTRARAYVQSRGERMPYGLGAVD